MRQLWRVNISDYHLNRRYRAKTLAASQRREGAERKR